MLTKILPEELLFSNNEEEDRVNTVLILDDYDWMNYELQTKFVTNKLGTLYVTFEYVGAMFSIMTVHQTLNGFRREYEYRYDSDVFVKYIKLFMQEHIKQWDSNYSFYGGDIALEFYNTVVEHGQVERYFMDFGISTVQS